MGRLKLSALLGAVVLLPLLPTGASAADLPEIPPPPPPAIEIGHSWYLRGHIGMANQHFGGITHPLIEDAIANDDVFQWLDKGNFDAVPTFGVGVGFQHSDKLRFDATLEYRGKSSFSALDYYDVDTGAADDEGTNNYTAKKSEYLFLVNGYYDLHDWHGVTPYVGAGIGASLNIIDDFRDTNTLTGNQAYAPSGSQWNFAWALHAGLGFQATPNLTVDLGYSFVSLGGAKSGILQTPGVACTACAPVTFKNLYSHDFKLGIRYAFDKPAYPDYGPAMVKY
jgi:opacity protein-like surface antigen